MNIWLQLLGPFGGALLGFLLGRLAKARDKQKAQFDQLQRDLAAARKEASDMNSEQSKAIQVLTSLVYEKVLQKTDDIHNVQLSLQQEIHGFLQQFQTARLDLFQQAQSNHNELNKKIDTFAQSSISAAKLRLELDAQVNTFSTTVAKAIRSHQAICKKLAA